MKKNNAKKVVNCKVFRRT